MADAIHQQNDENLPEAEETDSDSVSGSDDEEENSSRDEGSQQREERSTPPPIDAVSQVIDHRRHRNQSIDFRLRWFEERREFIQWVNERDLKDHELPLVRDYLNTVPPAANPFVFIQSSATTLQNRKMYLVGTREVGQRRVERRWMLPHQVDPGMIQIFRDAIDDMFRLKKRRDLYLNLELTHALEIDDIRSHGKWNRNRRNGHVMFEVVWKRNEHITDWRSIPHSIDEDEIEENEKPLVKAYLMAIPHHQNPFLALTGLEERAGVNYFCLCERKIGSSELQDFWVPEENLDPVLVARFMEKWRRHAFLEQRREQERNEGANIRPLEDEDLDEPPPKIRLLERRLSPRPGPSHPQN